MATGGCENNQVNIVPNDKYIEEAIVLNSQTGLIGMPQQTMGPGLTCAASSTQISSWVD
jgi:hypothetical protein